MLDYIKVWYVEEKLSMDVNELRCKERVCPPASVRLAVDWFGGPVVLPSSFTLPFSSISLYSNCRFLPSWYDYIIFCI